MKLLQLHGLASMRLVSWQTTLASLFLIVDWLQFAAGGHWAYTEVRYSNHCYSSQCYRPQTGPAARRKINLACDFKRGCVSCIMSWLLQLMRMSNGSLLYTDGLTMYGRIVQRTTGDVNVGN